MSMREVASACHWREFQRAIAEVRRCRKCNRRLPASRCEPCARRSARPRGNAGSRLAGHVRHGRPLPASGLGILPGITATRSRKRRCRVSLEVHSPRDARAGCTARSSSGQGRCQRPRPGQDRTKHSHRKQTPKPAKPAGKRKLILLAVPRRVAGRVGAGLWFTGVLPRLLGLRAQACEDRKSGGAGADLRRSAGDGRQPEQQPAPASYVKLRPASKSQAGGRGAGEAGHAATAGPVSDLPARNAPGGAARLRRHLSAARGTDRRANLAAAPAHITDVLFTQMLIQ